MSDSNGMVARDRTQVLQAHSPPARVTTGTSLKPVALPKIRLSIYRQEITRSDIALGNLEVKVENENRIQVIVTLANEDAASPHAADVKLSLLDSAGATICTESKFCDKVPAGGNYPLVFHFEAPNVVSRYASHWMSIAQRG